MRDAGFTLVELLIALSVLGLLTVLGASLLHMGARSWEHAQGDANSVDLIAVVQPMLRREIAQMQPVPRDGNAAQVAFDGQQDAITFRAPLPVGLGGGQADIRIAADGTNPKELVMEWRRDEHAPWRKSVLLPRVDRVQYQYYGTPAQGQPPGWQDRWSGRRELPRAIKLAVAFPDNALSWPEFVAVPMVTADPSCVYDATTKTCRSQ